MRILLKNNSTVKRLCLLALLTSQALVLSIVEGMLPIPIGIPGIKLGLANIITIVSLVYFGYLDTLFIILIRCIIASLFTGGPVIFLFSIAGAILSASVMWLLLKILPNFLSLVGISIAGSIFHNIGQITIACLLMSDMSVMYYLPVLLISGISMGCFVGFCSSFLIKAMKKIKLFSMI